MNILSLIAHDLTNEELRHYRFYAQRRNRNKERKDWYLLELYRKNEVVDDDRFRRALYGEKGDANTYARLKNRLTEDLNKALVAASFKEKEFEPWFYYITFQYYDLRNRHTTAYYYLKKTLAKAEACGFYDLAVIACHSLLRSQRYRSEKRSQAVLERLKSNEKFSRLRRSLEFHSALLEEELRRSQNLYGVRKILLAKAQQALKKTKDPAALPPVLNMLWLKLQCQILVFNHDYSGIKNLLEPRMEGFLKREASLQEEADLQATLLIYLLNAFTLCEDFDAVTQHSPQLEALLQKKPFLASRYRFFYYQTTVAAFCKIGRFSEALQLIHQMEGEKEMSVNPRYLIFAAINKALCLFETNRLPEALKTLARLKTMEAFKETDERLQVQAEIMEILLRLLVGDLDYGFHRCRQLLRDDLMPEPDDKHLLLHLVHISKLNLREMKRYLLEKVIADPQIRTHEDRQVINYHRWAMRWAESLK